MKLDVNYSGDQMGGNYLTRKKRRMKRVDASIDALSAQAWCRPNQVAVKWLELRTFMIFMKMFSDITAIFQIFIMYM